MIRCLHPRTHWKEGVSSTLQGSTYPSTLIQGTRVHTGIVGRTSTNERWQAEDCGRQMTDKHRNALGMAIGRLAIRQAAIIESRPTNLGTSAMVPCAWLCSIEPKVL